MKEKEEITPVKRFWLLLKPNKREIRQVYAFAILNGLVALSLPLGIQSIINLIQGGQVSTSWVVLVVLVLLGIGLGGLLQIMQLRITENIQQTIFTKAAFEFAFRIPRIKLKEFYDEYAPELVNRFFGTTTIQKGLSKILIDFSTAIFQIALGLLLLSLYHPFFIAIIIVLIILAFLILKLTGNRGLETSLKESKYKFLVAHWLEEIARANKTFKLAGENDITLRKTDKYVSSYLEARESHFSVLKTQYVYLVIFKIIVAGMLLAIGGMLVINQQMNIGQFVAAELIILLILNSVEKLILSIETIYDVLSSLEKIGMVMDLELEDESNNKTNFMQDQDSISVELKSVSFSYNKPAKNNLNNVSLKINAGEKIIIMGNNGSGKSTLLQIIAGLYETDSGSLIFNGLPIGNYSLSTLRSSIGTCFTGSPLFHGTLMENIFMGKKNISTNDILNACAFAGLEENIKELPKGLDTIVVPEGKTFSQSTNQKIAIARSIVSHPKLLLIDDSIDIIQATERIQIIKKLMAQENKWTLLIVSSDKSVAENCDKICLMENGNITAFDNYNKIKNLLPNLTDTHA